MMNPLSNNSCVIEHLEWKGCDGHFPWLNRSIAELEHGNVRTHRPAHTTRVMPEINKP
jgi:hypothetical protein